MIYTSKIENLKNKIYNNNPSFNLLGIFDLYDTNCNGVLSYEEFEAFLKDVGFELKVGEMHRLIIYLNCILSNSDCTDEIEFL